jgi:hypothetical protein
MLYPDRYFPTQLTMPTVTRINTDHACVSVESLEGGCLLYRGAWRIERSDREYPSLSPPVPIRLATQAPGDSPRPNDVVNAPRHMQKGQGLPTSLKKGHANYFDDDVSDIGRG